MTRRLLLLGVVLLFAASIPWNRGPEAPVVIWLGLPDWVTWALACYAAAAVLNALAWLATEIRDPDRPPPPDTAGRSGEEHLR